MYYRIIPFKRTFDTYWLVYKIPKILESQVAVWKIVKIPLQKTLELGILVSETSLEDINYSHDDIREIEEVLLDFIFLSAQQLWVIDFISKHYITPIHHALQLYFPKNLLEKIQKETFHKIKTQEYPYQNTLSFELNQKQNEVFDNIQSDTSNWKYLLYGVTGSGKTEIYMKLISENLKKEKQTLLLIPEIILTSQIGQRIQEVFWEKVIILHSGVSAAKKTQYWMDIHSWDAKIIIGTRSALFYPYNNLWMIIIDEEHDQSYNSDSAPRYNTLDVAEYISSTMDIPLLLGSWTPRVTTLYRWLQWEFEVLQLLEKYK